MTLLDLQDSLVNLVVKFDLDFFRIESLNLFLNLSEHVSLLHTDVGLGACARFGRNFAAKDSRKLLGVVFVCRREVLIVRPLEISLSHSFLLGRDRDHRLDLHLVIVKIVGCGVFATMVHLTL